MQLNAIECAIECALNAPRQTKKARQLAGLVELTQPEDLVIKANRHRQKLRLDIYNIDGCEIVAFRRE